MKLLLDEYNSLQSLLAHAKGKKDLSEVADRFTARALANIHRAIDKIGKAVEQALQNDIGFWQRQLELFPDSKSARQKLDSLLKDND